MTQVAEIKSPHEQRLEDNIAGKEDIYRESHKRVFKLLERFDGQKPAIDVERALFFTQSMAETVGQPLVLRWAKALMNVAKNITVMVQDDQLLLGRCGGHDGRYGILYPELDGDFLDIAVRDLPTRPQSPASISPEDAKIVVEQIAPFWKGRTYHEALNKALPAEVHKLTYDDPDGLISRFIVNETSSFRSSIQWVHDYEVVLKRGFNGLKQEMEEKLAALDPASPVDQVDKRPFIEATILVCDAIVLWAKRHADAARKAAEACADPVRKAELIRMAENAEHVPANPARDFYEAVQSQYFTQMFSRLEQKTGTTISNGRMDQYFYPFYKKDMEAGILTDEKTLEYLECMWVGMAEFIDMYISPAGGAFNEGYAHWEAVTIGGQTPDGRDATNDLTYLFLKSKREFPLHYPDLAARIHSRAPERYLWDVAETIKFGSGFPKLCNDEECIPLYVSKGATFEEALDYAVSGCIEIRMPNRDTYTSGGAYTNFASAVEMALYDGKMKKYGDVQLGIQTGDARKFKSWDEFWNAYVQQHMLLLRTTFIQQYIVIQTRAKHVAQPMGSVLHALCRKHCIDLHQPQIPEGLNFGYFEFMGLGTVIDSLAAIKKLVFEDKKLTMDQLIDALEANFEGYEDIQKLCFGAPKHGNDIEDVDQLTRRFFRDVERIYRSHGPDYFGYEAHMDPFSLSYHNYFAPMTGALPNGRQKGVALTDARVSAMPGTDVNGSTALIKSAAQAIDTVRNNCNHMNMKFLPSALEGPSGTRMLLNLIKTYFDLGGGHIQFNCVSSETLCDAQEHPQNYKNLVVRVAGFSSYFTRLYKGVQDEIIKRTEYQNV